MIKQVQSATYKGQLKAPASKSYMQRALAIALLAEGESILSNPTYCQDSMAAIEMCRGLGAEIIIGEHDTIVRPSLQIKASVLSAGESGFGVRCFIPIAALFSRQLTFIGEGSLKKRPLHMLEDPLRKLGAIINTQDGFLPFSTQGPIHGGVIHVDGSISSQVLTGFLIALPKTKSKSTIHVNDLKSIPYIDMTMSIMHEFGVDVTHDNYKTFYINDHQNYQPTNYEIEGDWSGIAFHLVGAAISGSVEISGVNNHSLQADIAILKALEMAGAQVEQKGNVVKVQKRKLNSFTFDASDCPDLFPPLTNLAVACQGTSIIKGIGRLIHKESNRALVLQKEWKKLGIEIILKDDEMHVIGGFINGGTIHSNNDHRIAMMGGVAGLTALHPISILDAESINKSYPKFFTDLDMLTKRNNNL